MKSKNTSRIILSIAVSLLLSCSCDGQVMNLMKLRWPIHLGDDNITGWQAPRTRGLSFEKEFYVEGPIRKAWIEYMVYGSRHPTNQIYVNGRESINLCEAPRGIWGICNKSIPVQHIKMGENTIEFTSRWYLVDYEHDDYMIKDLKLNVEYIMLEPYVVASKSQSAYQIRVGEEVNVSVILTNIGSRLAFNVSARDNRPVGCYLSNGNLDGFYSPLRGGDAYRYQHTIIPPETGEYISWPGKFSYYTANGSSYEGMIEPTQILVKPPTPRLIIEKSVSRESMDTGDEVGIHVKVRNNQTNTAYNVYVVDELPKGFSLVKGKNNATVGKLTKNESIYLNYTVSAETSNIYYIKATANYEDELGYNYSTVSNYVNLKVNRPFTPSTRSDPMFIIFLIAAIIIVLFIVYMRVSS